MTIHPNYRPALRSTSLFLLVLAVIQLAIWPSHPPSTVWEFVSYAPLHLLFETFSIIISILAFAVSWGVHNDERPRNLVLLACVFLGVASFDILHTLSYPGMPDFVTPSSSEKAINFWLGARAISAVGLLAFVFMTCEPMRHPATRWLALAATLALVGLAGWMGLFHPDWAPRTFIIGQGLTTFKVACEFAFIGLYVAAAVGFLWQMRVPQPYDVVSLFAAVCMMAMSETFFTLYTVPTDLFNFFGHVYKFIAYSFIYKCVFVSGIRRPYQQLHRSREALAESHALLRNIIETIPLRVYWKDRDSRYLGCNTAFAQDVGEEDPQSVVGKLDMQLKRAEWAELCHKDDVQVMTSEVPTKDRDEELATPDSQRVWLRTSKLPIRNSNKEVIGVLGVYDDITERKNAEEKQLLAASIYEASSEAIMVTDADNTILAVNPGFTRTTGYTAEEAVGQNTRILESGRHDTDFYGAISQAIDVTGHWQGELWLRHKNGELYASFFSISAIPDVEGGIHRYVALFSDITQKKKSEELIWQQANFDQLTGLPNRSMFYNRLEQEMKKANRASQPMALMLLDLDFFKEVNDTLGHDTGDRLLKDAAQRLRGCVRETDTVARLGGDEFSIVLGSLDGHDSVERIAQNILHKLAEPFHLGIETAYISASIGITLYPDDATEIDGLLKNADQAMYAAKHQGRNRCRYFTSAMQETAQARMRLANDLRHSLIENQFCLHYQPIVDLASGSIHKAEALIRWRHPRYGLIAPEEFIPIAEDTGMILEIGDWVFYEAALQVGRWRSAFHQDFQVSINKSPVQFRHERNGIAPWVDHLHKLGVAGEGIVVEITEGLLMDAGPTVSTHLHEVRDAGMHVSLDDFGTGYSSLSYLKKFDIDYLKIDQSFVRNLGQRSHDLILCEAIIAMAHKLGIKVVAEGVETEEQRDLLRATGCDYAQGFFYSRPVPPEEFEELLVPKGRTH